MTWISYIWNILKNDTHLKTLLKLFIQDSIYQKFHSCRENTFTKVIKNEKKKKY